MVDDQHADGERLLELNDAAPDKLAFRASLTPEQIRELDRAYLDQEREIAREWERAAQPPQQQSEHRANEARQHEPGAKPKSKTKKPPTGKPRRSTGFSQGRVNQRKADLFAVHRHDFKKRNKKATTASFEAFVSRLAAAFPRRDLFDPDSVDPAELGAGLNVTLAQRLAIEDAEHAFRLDEKWTKPGGKPYRLKTIRPRDATAEELEAHYHRARNRALTAKRKQARAEGRNQPKETTHVTQTNATPRKSWPTYREAIADQVAHTRAQIDALRRAIDGEWRTLADLAAAVQRDPAWREIDKSKLRQTIVDRLKAMRGEIENQHVPGPRCNRLRMVRRRPETTPK